MGLLGPQGIEGRSADLLPFPDRPMHQDPCPNCEHFLGEHVDEFGCVAGWEWEGPESPYAGLSKSEGCQCPLTLAGQYDPPGEGDV